MAVGDEDVAIGGDCNVAGTTERVGPVAAHALRSKRHQQLSVGAVFEHLLADAISSLTISNPESAEAIDADAVRPREQLLAPHFEDFPVTIELDDRRFRTMKCVDSARGIDRHARHFAPGTAVWQRTPSLNQAIGPALRLLEAGAS